MSDPSAIEVQYTKKPVYPNTGSEEEYEEAAPSKPSLFALLSQSHEIEEEETESYEEEVERGRQARLKANLKADRDRAREEANQKKRNGRGRGRGRVSIQCSPQKPSGEDKVSGFVGSSKTGNYKIHQESAPHIPSLLSKVTSTPQSPMGPSVPLQLSRQAIKEEKERKRAAAFALKESYGAAWSGKTGTVPVTVDQAPRPPVRLAPEVRLAPPIPSKTTIDGSSISGLMSSLSIKTSSEQTEQEEEAQKNISLRLAATCALPDDSPPSSPSRVLRSKIQKEHEVSPFIAPRKKKASSGLPLKAGRARPDYDPRLYQPADVDEDEAEREAIANSLKPSFNSAAAQDPAADPGEHPGEWHHRDGTMVFRPEMLDKHGQFDPLWKSRDPSTDRVGDRGWDV